MFYFVQIMNNISVNIIKKTPTFTFAGILHQKFCLAQFFVWVQFVLLAATRTTLFGKISIPLHPLILLLIEATLHQSWHITTIFLYTLIFLYKKKRNHSKHWVHTCILLDIIHFQNHFCSIHVHIKPIKFQSDK